METKDVSAPNERLVIAGPTSTDTVEGIRKSTSHLGPYTITVVLNQDNQFLGIEEVGMDKSFLDYRQRISLAKAHDIEPFVEEVE